MDADAAIKGFISGCTLEQGRQLAVPWSTGLGSITALLLVQYTQFYNVEFLNDHESVVHCSNMFEDCNLCARDQLVRYS